jgi:hypothetical protein
MTYSNTRRQGKMTSSGKHGGYADSGNTAAAGGHQLHAVARKGDYSHNPYI